MSSFGKNSSYKDSHPTTLKELGDYLDNKQEGKPTPPIKTIGFDTNTAPISIPNSGNSSSSGVSVIGKSPKQQSTGGDKTPSPSLSSTGKKNNNNNSSSNATSPKDSPSVSSTTSPTSKNSGDSVSKVTSSLNDLKIEKQPINTPSSSSSAPPTPNQQGQQHQKKQQNQKQNQKQQQADKKESNKQQQQQQHQESSSSSTSALKDSKEVNKSEGQHGIKQYDDPKQKGKITKKKIIKGNESSRSVQLFNHLPQYNGEFSMGVSVSTDEPNDDKYPIHPEIISLGLKYADFKIAGSNARAIAMMTAFIQIFKDYEAAPDKVYSRELDMLLKRNIQFLVDCRPISISMGNSINYIKHKLSLTNNMTHSDAKEYLIKSINEFIERIQMADNAIVKHGCSKIHDGDVILTYASSHVVELIIQQAIQDKKQFRLIIVDSRPKHEGRELLHRLVLHGVKITYIMLHAVSYIMKEVTKVFVGAYSVLSNGNLISRSGTSLVASMAKLYNVPFIVCCETYKFTERVQLDSICFNQIGNPQDLVQCLGEKEGSKSSLLENWESHSSLKLLNLMYDLTPIELIDMVITEFGMLPPTSIPVVLREYRKEVISIN